MMKTKLVIFASIAVFVAVMAFSFALSARQITTSAPQVAAKQITFNEDHLLPPTAEPQP